MVSELIHSGVAVGTVRTSVRLLAGMRFDMAVQVPALLKGPSAIGTGTQDGKGRFAIVGGRRQSGRRGVDAVASQHLQ